MNGTNKPSENTKDNKVKPNKRPKETAQDSNTNSSNSESKMVSFDGTEFELQNKLSFRSTPHPKSKRLKVGVTTPVSLDFDDSDSDPGLVEYDNFNHNLENKPRGNTKKIQEKPLGWRVTALPTESFSENDTLPSNPSENDTLLSVASDISAHASSDVSADFNFDPNRSLAEKIHEKLRKENLIDRPSTSRGAIEVCVNIKPSLVLNDESSSESDQDGSISDICGVQLSEKSCEIIEPQLPEKYLLSFTEKYVTENGSDEQDEEDNLDDETNCSKDSTDEKEISEIQPAGMDNIQCFILPKHVILILKHPMKIHFHGRLSFIVLSGSVEVLGHVFHKNVTKSIKVYSPRGHSFLNFETVLGQRNTKLREVLSNMEMYKKDLKICSEITESHVVLALTKFDDNLTKYLKLHVAQQLFGKKAKQSNEMKRFSMAERLLDASITVNPDSWRTFAKNEEWNNIIDSIAKLNENTRVLLAGGRNVGKSTLLRYCINKLLNDITQVVVIDLDPGQPEFTIPSCVSVTIVKSPILGPNYTHLQNPVRSYFVGHINVLDSFKHYIKCVTELMHYCNENITKKVPWIINTMGFTKDLGIDIMTSIIKIVSPTEIIQINSKHSHLNFPDTMTPEYVRKHVDFLAIDVPDSELNYEVKIVESMALEKVQGEWEIAPRQVREMLILAYFSQMLGNNREITAVPPFVCKLSSLRLLCLGTQPDDIPAAMNANLVALCCVDDLESYMPVAVCVGFAAVRGIDIGNDDIYLLSPVDEDLLESVNCLWMGAVTLPPSMYMTPGEHGGHIPYVSYTVPQATGGIPKRNFRPFKSILDHK